MGYNNNYKRNNNRYQDQPKKHSGAQETIIKSGKSKGLRAINAWNYSASKGMIKIKAFENKKSTRSVGKESGYKFVSLAFEVFYEKTGNSFTEWAQYNVSTGKAFLERLNMVVSTKAPNKGYCGKVS